MDPSLISEKSACENSLGMKGMCVFERLCYTVARMTLA